MLVVTYKDCEAAFAGIPGVEVAHFNAIAGLDVYRDVAAARSSSAGRCRATPSSARSPRRFFGTSPAGGYQPGAARRADARRHQPGGAGDRAPDAEAELLRAAICDDEVIQAIGRGRGLNRTAADPLEVHVLADVALPLVHDRVLAWETVAPDIVQRMLLAGIAVDSPADAARAASGAVRRRRSRRRRRSSERDLSGQNPIRNTL